jgi:hypothetical protein
MRSNARRKISLCDRGLISAQASCAWCATPTAVVASGTVPLAISVMASSVAGVHDRDPPVSVERLAAYDWAERDRPEGTLDFVGVVHGGPSWWGMCVSRQGLNSRDP